METEVVAGLTVADHVRAAKEANTARAQAEHHPQRHSLKLKDADGKDLDPSAALRRYRAGDVDTYFNNRIKSRMSRWIASSTAMIIASSYLTLSGDTTTIAAGEVWLVL